MISKNVQMCFYLGIKSRTLWLYSYKYSVTREVSQSFNIKELQSLQATGHPF